MSWKLGRTFGALALTMLALGAGLVATPANAAPAPQAAAVDTRQCTDDSYGGTWYCAYGSDSHTFPNGTNQIFVVGTDFAVWTKWRNRNNNYSSWHSLGGEVKHSYNSADFGIFTCGSSPNLWVSVRGTNNANYLNVRTYSTGKWSGWNLGTSVAC
jgi:hypothetical protein